MKGEEGLTHSQKTLVLPKRDRVQRAVRRRVKKHQQVPKARKLPRIQRAQRAQRAKRLYHQC